MNNQQPLSRTDRADILANAFVGAPDDRLNQALVETIDDLRRTCTWTFDEDGFWATACGREWVYECDGPAEHGVQFCQGCGAPLVLVPHTNAEMT